METALERIRAKITELEEKLASLRIAERELQELGEASAPKTHFAPQPAVDTEVFLLKRLARKSRPWAAISTIARYHSHFRQWRNAGSSKALTVSGRWRKAAQNALDRAATE
jgi:16S rRNA A1518/A1519 N6-dimethyltransferase RsmA/KsgA/DIM1 with predicted DNA glycosylase/AP lyase activity